MNIANGSLAVVDGKVFWKGEYVPTEVLFLHYDGATRIVRFEIKSDVNPTVLADIEAAGIKVRRLK